MNKAEKLYKQVKEVDFTIDMKPFSKCSDGAISDVESKDGRSDYYQWLPKLIKHTQPKQIVELGGAMGVACIAMLQTLPKTSKLYSITLPEQGQEFSMLDREYPNLIKIIGNDLDLKNWPKDCDLSKTDIWFIDSEHTYEQVRAEVDIYRPFFKEGAILLFDDTHINEGLKKIWKEIQYELPGYKYESDLHWSGYGIVVVGDSNQKYYAQDEIDRWIVENLSLPDKGVIVDVGAGDGVNMSNSKLLEDRGWTAICIDADPRVADDLVKNRKHGHSALISSNKTKQTFYMNNETPDISGIIKTDNNKDKSTELAPVTLESILEKENIGKIDILSIDTEGSEIDAFESMDWQKHKPQYLVVEYITQKYINEEIAPYFIDKGYKPVGKHGPNMIFELPEPIVKDPHLLVYGSSYDRGLEHLLKMWPEIRKAVPDARLRVFYGWNLFDVAYHDNPERMAWKEKINNLMEQDGITHLGRIGHEAVKKEFEMAGIWAYPAHFAEISCITAMKAQAYGAVPCVIDYAALKETVQFGVKVKGDIYDQETKDLYRNSLIALLNDPKYQDEVRKEMIPWAKEKFKWQNVAIQWNEEFTRDLTDEEKDARIEVEVVKLLEDNQVLKAWDLVKDTNWSKKDRLWLRVKHAFNKEDYIKYYSEQLEEHPVKEEYATQADIIYPRFQWMVQSIVKQGAKDMIDLGCADGYLPLTLAKKGIVAMGVNLYKPSVELAIKRAEKLKLNAMFECDDLMNIDHANKFDAVVLSEVLEHLPNPQEAIDHCMSLVAEGGSFYLTTPSPEHTGISDHKNEAGRKPGDWDDGLPAGHLQIFTEKELKDMLKNYIIKQFLIDEQGCFLVEVKNA